MAADLVELRMNVAALKRVDPYIKDILGSATQVALYSFSALKNEWEKTDVEGALFICSRNGEPFNSILIMNRLNTNNLVEPIVKDLDWQIQAPFLLYKNPRNNIFGIWFYNKDECVKISTLIETIMESLRNKQDREKQQKRPTNGADIFSMLSKAQEDFNKTPVKTETQSNQSQITQPQSSTPRAPDVTSQSVMDFFAKASTTKTSHPTPVRIPQVEKEQLPPLLHRLMSNPVHTVEHIEKQHRAVTPQELLTSTILGKPLQQKSDAIICSPITPIQTTPVAIDRSNTNLLENGINFMRIASPTTASSPHRGFYLQQSVTEEIIEPKTSITPPLINLLDNSQQKPALMPPMMFATTVTTVVTKEKEEFIPPEPLTQKQLLQAFNYLLKNDPDFITKLHEAYVKSLKEMCT